MESIKDKVAIIGVGTNKRWGELYDQDETGIVLEAVHEALDDAGVGIGDIQAAWVGGGAPTGNWLTSIIKQYIPVTKVENACATGAETVRGCTFGLLSKTYDLVMAVGVGKMKDAPRGGEGAGDEAGVDKYHPVTGATGIPAGRYALAATRYFSRYGLSRQEGKHMLAMISSKSHYNGARNPRAMFQREVSVETCENSPIIAWPLGLYDCCAQAEGAAAAILCRTEDAKSFRPDYITIKGIGISVGPGMRKFHTGFDFTHWEESTAASKQAYEQAGIKNPREELDMAECHDCFSIAEAIAVESVGLCERGTIRRDVEAGTFTLEGKLPVNASGGLKSFGHPPPASGIREMFETYKQIIGKAEYQSRQLKNVELGLCHNQGGHPGRFECSVTILGIPGK
ncbi:MAG: acetyl-CoA acetyltransferase [Chloroflexi bacterium]|nr:acetyl-CoA acetyltransferase [Chloroflexota bacterium]MBI3930770.1 acetyl-CoA acetyltransferase [Chloroflexota bacterium]